MKSATQKLTSSPPCEKTQQFATFGSSAQSSRVWHIRTRLVPGQKSDTEVGQVFAQEVLAETIGQLGMKPEAVWSSPQQISPPPQSSGPSQLSTEGPAQVVAHVPSMVPPVVSTQQTSPSSHSTLPHFTRGGSIGSPAS